MKSIGVITAKLMTTRGSLKHAALVFDQLQLVIRPDTHPRAHILTEYHRRYTEAPPDAQKVLADLRDAYAESVKDFYYLIDEGIANFTPLESLLDIRNPEFIGAIPYPNSAEIPGEFQKLRRDAANAEAWEIVYARGLAAKLRKRGQDAVPLLTKTPYVISSKTKRGRELVVDYLLGKEVDVYEHARSADEENDSRTQVLRIVLTEIPYPDEGTAWEQIDAFRRDPESRSALLRLRQWITSAASSQITEVELSQQLEFLIDEYRSYLRLHRMKHRVGAWETLLSVPGEIVENLLKLRLGKLMGPLFKIVRHRYEFLEAERAAPGRELAFIVRAQDRFGSP